MVAGRFPHLSHPPIMTIINIRTPRQNAETQEAVGWDNPIDISDIIGELLGDESMNESQNAESRMSADSCRMNDVEPLVSMNGDSILQEIEKQVDTMRLGFTLNAEDKEILDQPHLASKFRLLRLENRLPCDIKNELFRIANSSIHSKNCTQKASDFWEVSQALGLENMKAHIFSSALFSLATKHRDILELKHKSLATAGLSLAIVHNILGFDLKHAPMVQLCALVSEFGKIPFFVYRQKHSNAPEIAEIMTEDYINIHHGKIGLMMIKKFDLPDFLGDLFEKKSLIFFDQPHQFSLTTIVRIAKLLVRDSFKHHGKLILTSVVDDAHGAVWGSVGTEIQSFFDALGIAHLIEIIPHETAAQQYCRIKNKQ
jgi:hypothetical protein